MEPTPVIEPLRALPSFSKRTMPKRSQLEALVALANLAAGDASALEPLYDLFAKDLYGLAAWRSGSAEEAADVVQEVFVRLALQRDRLLEVRDPRAYVLTMGHRITLDQARKKLRRRTVSLEESPALDLAYLETDTSDAERTVDAARAERALSRLPAVQREAIYLHIFLEMTFAAVGRVTRVSTFTAATRVRLGLRRLRRLLGVERR